LSHEKLISLSLSLSCLPFSPSLFAGFHSILAACNVPYVFTLQVKQAQPHVNSSISCFTNSPAYFGFIMIFFGTHAKVEVWGAVDFLGFPLVDFP
jgi:hypothetical protein